MLCILPNGDSDDDDGVIKVSVELRSNTDYDFTCMCEREWWRQVITAYHHHHYHRFFSSLRNLCLSGYLCGWVEIVGKALYLSDFLRNSSISTACYHSIPFIDPAYILL